jgi:hypothetical protein
MSEENETGSNAVWAIAMIIIVAIIAGVLYFSGILTRRQKTDVDINVTVPAAAPATPAPSAPAR